MITDPHSGFANDIVNKLRHLVGIREYEKSAARAKGKVAIMERSNQDLRISQDDGFAKGGTIKEQKRFQTISEFCDAETKSSRVTWATVTSTAAGRDEDEDSPDTSTTVLTPSAYSILRTLAHKKFRLTILAGK